jgi:hypothetical protein
MRFPLNQIHVKSGSHSIGFINEWPVDQDGRPVIFSFGSGRRADNPPPRRRPPQHA